jgi:CRP-like cAMP-binding protein
MKRKFSVKALDDCELIKISKEDLEKTSTEFPDIASDLFENAIHRMTKFRQLKKLAEDEFEKYHGFHEN